MLDQGLIRRRSGHLFAKSGKGPSRDTRLCRGTVPLREAIAGGEFGYGLHHSPPLLLILTGQARLSDLPGARTVASYSPPCGSRRSTFPGGEQAEF